MPLPVTFTSLPQGSEPLSLLDAQFNALGVLTTIPCAAIGQNSVILTPATNTPSVSIYTTLTPVFTWVQSQTTTGAVTIQISGLSPLAAYGSNGGVALGSGDLAAGNTYQCVYNPSLNSNAGGFVVNSFSAITTVGNWVPVLVGDSVVGTPTYSGQQGTYEQIGRQVTARFNVIVTALTGIAGNVAIGGLPVANNAVSIGTTYFSLVRGWTGTAGYTFIGGLINPSVSYTNIFANGSGQAFTLVPIAEFAATVQLVGCCSYHV